MRPDSSPDSRGRYRARPSPARNALLNRLGAFFRRATPLLLIPLDVVIWFLALIVASYSLEGFDWQRVDDGNILIAAAIAGTTTVVCGLALGIYRGRWLPASFEETVRVALCALSATVALLAVVAVRDDPQLIPLGVAMAAGAYQLIGALTARSLGRLVTSYLSHARHERDHRVLIFGAGDAGFQAARALQNDPESDMLPVAFLDDDPAKSRLRLAGLPIVGSREDIAWAKAKYVTDVMLVAIPTAATDDIADVADRALAARMAVRIVPRLAKYFESGGRVQVSDIRDITLRDFLSRDEIRLDLDQIAGYLSGRRVLITGAGGSIGSQLCETVRSFRPAQVIMVDHDENALQELQLRLDAQALLQSESLVLADITDREGIREVFRQYRPHVVFHTAAHKHVTLLERFPSRAFHANVLGTRNVLDAAMLIGVERFVNVSTDKAANPVSTLGITKRIAEMLTAYYAGIAEGTYMSVRFGNVLGSRGSVVPTIEHQVRAKVPITITDPQATRFFMTVGEAVQLVVQAGALGKGGDVLTLDMGKPVKILDLALRLASAMEPGTIPDVVFTGLRPGEKLHEQLVGSDDQVLDAPHELITRVSIPSLDPRLLDDLGTEDAAGLAARLRDLALLNGARLRQN